MTDIILHHYPQSPVAEKARVILGIKSLNWQSVEIPRIPPKPDLMPLTGGYRRTPVMQIGADMFCDSQCIIDELQKRHNHPTLYPNDSNGIAWGISRWVDGPMFTHAITVVLGAAESLPADFAADRGRLYFGPDFKLENLQTEVQHSISQLTGQFAWFEEQLGHSKPFMLGDEPGLVDVLAYYLFWFLHGRWNSGPEFFEQFKQLCHWKERVADIGHGKPSALSSTSALDIAKRNQPSELLMNSADFSPEIRSGSIVSIEPDVNGGDPAVTGTLTFCDSNRIGITRVNDQIGKVAIHFPRVGYRVNSVR